jgi:hypothetical protein
MKKRIIIILSLILIIISFGGLIFSRYFIKKTIENKIISYVHKINKQLNISSIELDIPFKIILKGVSYNDRYLSFNSEKIYIFFDIINIFKNVKIISSISKLYFYRPKIKIYLNNIDNVDISSQNKNWIKLISRIITPINRLFIYWDNGDLFFCSNKEFAMTGTDGIVIFRDKKILLTKLKKGNLVFGNNTSNINSDILCDFSGDKLSGKIKIDEFDISDLNLEYFSYNLKGKANFIFNLSGKITEPIIRFQYLLKDINWNKIKGYTQGEGEYSVKQYIKFNGLLKIPDYCKDVKYNFSLFYPDNKINVRMNLTQLDLNLFFKDVIRTPLSIEGKYNCLLNITGEKDSPELYLFFKSYQSKFLSKYWTDSEIQANISVLKTGEIIYKISNSFFKSEDEVISFVSDDWNTVKRVNMNNRYEGTYNFNVNIQNFQYNGNVIFGKTNLSGNWLKNNSYISVDTVVELNGFWINQHMFENKKFKIKYESDKNKKLVLLDSYPGENYSFSGSIDFSVQNIFKFNDINIKYKNNNFLTINGVYCKDKSNIIIKGEKFGTEIITELSDLKAPFSGISDFIFILKGDLKYPYITGMINIVSGEIYGLHISNMNIHCKYKNGILILDNMRLVELRDGKEIFVITGEGNIPLKKYNENIPVNLTVKIEKGDISILENYYDLILKANGKISAELSITGTISDPVYKGFIVVNNADIISKKYINRISNLDVNIEFTNNKLMINNISANIGKGKIKSEGYISFLPIEFNSLNTETIKFLKINDYNIELKTIGNKGIKVYIPELPIPASSLIKQVSGSPSFGELLLSLKLTGNEDYSRLNGYVQLNNGHFSILKSKSFTDTKTLTDILGDPVVDIELKPGINTWYENELMSMNIIGSLKITGKISNLLVNGKIESYKGNINYLGRIYDIKESIFEVIDNELYFQAEAETKTIFTTKKLVSSQTKNKEQTIKDLYEKKEGVLQLIIPRAPIENVQTYFKSREDLGLSPEKISESAVAGLISNLTPEEQQIYLRQQLIRLFDASLTSPLARRILQRIGIDSLRADWDSGIEDINRFSQSQSSSLSEYFSGMQYILEKNLGDVSLLYIYTFDKTEYKFEPREEIQITVRLRKNVLLRTTYEYQNPSGEKDRRAIIEAYWRFGWDTYGIRN